MKMNGSKTASFFLLVTILSFLFFFLTGCEQGQEKTLETSENKDVSREKEQYEYNQNSTPTLFFHGYKGTKYSFGSMVYRIQKTDVANKAGTLLIKNDGSIEELEAYNAQETKNPLLLILFEDNKNNEWNQADWIKTTFLYLKKNYEIDQVNVVGHSMGGVSMLRYLTAYGAETSLLKVNRFVAIGAPFNGFEESVDSNQEITEVDQKGPALKSSRYLEYETNIRNYPSTTSMLNIAGNLDDGSISDGVVPVSSVAAIGTMIKNTGADYIFKEFHGPQSQHSELHENSSVDQAVIDFLWGR